MDHVYIHSFEYSSEIYSIIKLVYNILYRLHHCNIVRIQTAENADYSGKRMYPNVRKRTHAHTHESVCITLGIWVQIKIFSKSAIFSSGCRTCNRCRVDAISNLACLGCGAGSPHQSVSQIPYLCNACHVIGSR